MISRLLKDETLASMKEFKCICITGPRQSGKTTLAKSCFPHLPYISLEDPDVANAAANDGRKFLQQFPKGAILDEVQRVPDLFRYLQTHLDKNKRNGQFVLSGSNNFLLQENISQSLAGRVAYIDLLPFSLQEIQAAKKKLTIDEYIFNGGYPSVITAQSTAARWLPNYIKTYLDRDVRLLRNVGNMRQFQQFVFLCAARAGQLLNIQSIAKAINVDHKTIQAWLSVLESSYIIYLVQPYYTNFNKRVIKAPKLYFYDTGILCYLLGIKSSTALRKHEMYGNVFENYVMTEIVKNRANKQQYGNVSFFRDSAGNEVDVILEKDGQVIPVEIKAAKKSDSGMMKNLTWWQKLSRQQEGVIVYQGKDQFNEINNIQWLNWDGIKAL